VVEDEKRLAAAIKRGLEAEGFAVDVAFDGTDGLWQSEAGMTAKDGEYDEAEALDTGADDFLSKPFSYVVLVAHLRALMRRGNPERPAVLGVGDLEIDAASHEVRRAGTPVALTPREFSILEFLARHVGEVLAKSEILEHIWDFAFEGDSNVVEVHVASLRRKIDKPFGRHAIETIRGVGYRLASNGG
jgi:DNA-binding response OmpR family regulator